MPDQYVTMSTSSIEAAGVPILPKRSRISPGNLFHTMLSIIRISRQSQYFLLYVGTWSRQIPFLVVTTMPHALSEWNLFNVFIRLIEAGMISAIIFSWVKMAKCTRVVVGIVKELTLLVGIMMPSVLPSEGKMNVVICSRSSRYLHHRWFH